MGQETRDKRQETRDKRQETRDKRQETRDKRQETRQNVERMGPPLFSRGDTAKAVGELQRGEGGGVLVK